MSAWAIPKGQYALRGEALLAILCPWTASGAGTHPVGRDKDRTKASDFWFSLSSSGQRSFR